MRRVSGDSGSPKRCRRSGGSHSVAVLFHCIHTSGGKPADCDSHLWHLPRVSEEVYRALEALSDPEQGYGRFLDHIPGLDGYEECVKGMFEGGWDRYKQHGLSVELDDCSTIFILHGSAPKLSENRLTKTTYLKPVLGPIIDDVGALLYFGDAHSNRNNPTGGEAYRVPARHMPPGFHRLLEFESRRCLDKSNRECPPDLSELGNFMNSIFGLEAKFHPWTPFRVPSNRRIYTEIPLRFYSLASMI